MKITVDQEACVGAGSCVMAAEAVFDQRESDGIVELLQESPAAELHEKVRDAAMLCPALAIQIDD